MSEKIRVEVRPQHDAQVEELEYEVYTKAGYIPPNPRRKVLENMHYPKHKVVVALSGNLITGSVRLVIDPAPKSGLFSLRCFKPFPLWPWAQELLQEVRPDRVMQVGTMVIREPYRGGETFQAIFKKILEMSLQGCIQYAVTTVDEGFFNRLSARNVPFVPMGDTRFYMGSRTVPALVARDWVTRGAVPREILARVQKEIEDGRDLASAVCSA